MQIASRSIDETSPFCLYGRQWLASPSSTCSLISLDLSGSCASSRAEYSPLSSSLVLIFLLLLLSQPCSAPESALQALS